MSNRKYPKKIVIDWYPPFFADGRMHAGGIGFHTPTRDLEMRRFRKERGVVVLTYTRVTVKRAKRKRGAGKS